jgi:hypothetical protein
MVTLPLGPSWCRRGRRYRRAPRSGCRCGFNQPYFRSGLRYHAFPLYCTKPIHPTLGHRQMKLGECKSRFQPCGLLLHESSTASAGNQRLPGGGVGVATVASPLSCTNPRHPSLGHGRTALSYSRVHSPTGVAWPPMVTLSLGSPWRRRG